MLIQLLGYGLLTVIAAVALVNLLAKLKVRQFKRVKNFGPNKPNHLRSAGILNMIREVFGLEKRDKMTINVQYLHDFALENKMFHVFIGPLSAVQITSGDLAKIVYMDPKTYIRKLIPTGGLLHYLSAASFPNSTEEFWKPRRSIMNPSFANLQNYFSSFEKTINECLDLWDQQLGKSNETVIKEFPEYMVHLALDVLGRSIFKYEFNSLLNKSDLMADDYNYLVPQSMTLFHNAFPWWWKLPTERNKSLQFRIKRFRDSLDEIIKQAKDRKAREMEGHQVDEKYNYTSLLEVMLDTQDEESGIKMTEEEIRDSKSLFMCDITLIIDCFAFFLAGHETVSSLHTRESTLLLDS
jgi:cytochrome P450